MRFFKHLNLFLTFLCISCMPIKNGCQIHELFDVFMLLKEIFVIKTNSHRVKDSVEARKK